MLGQLAPSAVSAMIQQERTSPTRPAADPARRHARASSVVRVKVATYWHIQHSEISFTVTKAPMFEAISPRAYRSCQTQHSFYFPRGLLPESVAGTNAMTLTSTGGGALDLVRQASLASTSRLTRLSISEKSLPAINRGRHATQKHRTGLSSYQANSSTESPDTFGKV